MNDLLWKYVGINLCQHGIRIRFFEDVLVKVMPWSDTKWQTPWLRDKSHQTEYRSWFEPVNLLAYRREFDARR